jgi:hypothetical protein
MSQGEYYFFVGFDCFVFLEKIGYTGTVLFSSAEELKLKT